MKIEKLDKIYYKFFGGREITARAYSVRKNFDDANKRTWYLLELHGKNKEEIIRITEEILALPETLG